MGRRVLGRHLAQLSAQTNALQRAQIWYIGLYGSILRLAHTAPELRFMMTGEAILSVFVFLSMLACITFPIVLNILIYKRRVEKLSLKHVVIFVMSMCALNEERISRVSRTYFISVEDLREMRSIQFYCMVEIVTMLLVFGIYYDSMMRK